MNNIKEIENQKDKKTDFFSSPLMDRLLAPFRDTNTRLPSSSPNISALDGIRGFAALFVVASHTRAFFFSTSQGAIGVYLFFALSGFLLSIPFANQPEKQPNVTHIRGYFIRRFLRIMPLYSCVIIIYTALYRPDLISMIQHFILIRGDIHFWSIPAEMFNYILLPIFVIIISKSFSQKKLVKSFLIIFLMYFAVTAIYDIFLTKKLAILSLSKGKEIRQKFYPGIFLLGSFSCYIYYNESIKSFLERKFITIFLDLAGISSLLIFLISSKLYTNLWFFFGFKNPPNAWANPYLYTLLTSILILSAVINTNGVTGRIFRLKFLRHFGIVSFGVYLFHLLYMPLGGMLAELTMKKIYSDFQFFAKLERTTLQHIFYFLVFFFTTLLSYIISYFTYMIIERPFLKLKSKTWSFSEA